MSSVSTGSRTRRFQTSKGILSRCDESGHVLYEVLKRLWVAVGIVLFELHLDHVSAVAVVESVRLVRFQEDNAQIFAVRSEVFRSR